MASGPASALVAENFRALGHVNTGGGSPAGDVFFYDYGGSFGKYAFVGAWSSPCTGAGVKIVDVNNPRKPMVVAEAGRRVGVSNEDIAVIDIGGQAVLGVGVQFCGSNGTDGLALFDVSNPSRPRALSFHHTPSGVHELDLVARPDGRSLALLATPFTEFFDTYFGTDFGGEFRIVDITDPANPVETADWGVIADSSLKNFAGDQEVSSSFQGLGYYAAHYAHSARAADGGMTAYVSYWDSGVLKFDISDPANPVLVGRTPYGVGDDGDAHSLATYDAGGRRYILQNDEDGDALSPALVTSSATGATQYHGIEEPWAPTLLSESGPVSGEVHDANDGCQAADFSGADGKVALVDSYDPFYVGILPGFAVPCPIGTQVELAGRAGASAMLSNLISPDDAWPFARGLSQRGLAAAVGMPVVQVSGIDGLAAAIRGTAGADTVTLTPQEPTLGHLRIFDESSAADINGDGTVEYTQVAAVDSLPHVSGELSVPAGTWNIHNTEVRGNRAYSSWMSNGVVAIDISNPTAPQVVGQFVPRVSRRLSSSLGVGPTAIWGVAVDPATGIIYASDMRSGLWIVEPLGPAGS